MCPALKHAEIWQPSKFVITRRGWRANRDANFVHRGSRFTADILARAYSDVVSRYARGEVLDYGAGTVPLYGMYRDCATSVTCVDWEATHHDMTHTDLLVDLSTPIGDWAQGRSFDTVIATDVLEHLPYPTIAWSNLRQLCRSGGHVIVGVPFLYWVHEQPHDYFRATEFALRRLATEAGFDVLELQTYGGAVEVLIDLLAKLTSRVPALCALLSMSGALLLKIPWIRRLSARSSSLFPLGYVMVAAPAHEQPRGKS